MTFIDLVVLIFSGVGGWIVFLLVIKTRESLSNVLLAMVVLIGFCYVFLNMVHFKQLYQSNHQLLFLPINWSWGIGPFLFLYFKYRLKHNRRWTYKDLLHLLPWLTQVAFHLYWYVQPFTDKLEFYENLYYGPIRSYEQLIGVTIGLAYAFISYRFVSSFIDQHEGLENKQSRLVLIWSQNLALLFFIFLAIWFIQSIYPLVVGYQVELPLVAYYHFFFVVIFLTLYVARQIHKFPAITETDIDTQEFSHKNKVLEKKLQQLAVPRMFDLELGPYPIDELSALLEVEPNYLSSYFRVHYSTNYPGYIRRLRMAEFNRLVQEATERGQEVSVNQLQKNCGYRNRGSFNRDVKEVFDRSPSEYIKVQLNSSELKNPNVELRQSHPESEGKVQGSFG